MLVMLLQSILGVPDHIIVEDYYTSDKISWHGGSAAAVAALGERQYGRLDPVVFSRATREAMVSTLEYLRRKYGSISPGYLDHIGFTNEWRQRILRHLKKSNQFQTSRMKNPNTPSHGPNQTLRRQKILAALYILFISTIIHDNIQYIQHKALSLSTLPLVAYCNSFALRCVFGVSI